MAPAEALSTRKQDVLRKELASLDLLLNASAPVNRLPDELLVEIFTHFRTRILASTFNPRFIPARWMAIPAVCRRWRHVVCSTSLFWRTIDVHRNPGWLTLSLSRAANARPDVNFLDANFPPPKLLILFRHGPWLRSLSFVDAKSSWVPYLAPLFFMPMPVLESLNFHKRPDNVREDLGLRANLHPKLTSLTLHGLFAPNDPAIYANLRSLELADCNWSSSFDSFLDLLQAGVRLDRLVLDNCLEQYQQLAANQQLPTRTLPIVLPTLRTLHLRGHQASLTSSVLSNLGIPNAVNVVVEGDVFVYFEGDVTTGVSDFLPTNTLTNLPILATVHSVDVIVDNYINDLRGESSTGATVRLSLFSSLADILWLSSLHHLTSVYSVVNLMHIGIVGDYNTLSVDIWQELFETFDNLENLTLSGTGQLDSMWVGLNYQRRQPIACPRLRIIATGHDEHGLVDTDVFSTLMLQTLRERSDRGSQLNSLNLRLYRSETGTFLVEGLNRDEFLKELEELVDDVNFREIGLYYPDA